MIVHCPFISLLYPLQCRGQSRYANLYVFCRSSLDVFCESVCFQSLRYHVPSSYTYLGKRAGSGTFTVHSFRFCITCNAEANIALRICMSSCLRYMSSANGYVFSRWYRRCHRRIRFWDSDQNPGKFTVHSFRFIVHCNGEAEITGHIKGEGAVGLLGCRSSVDVGLGTGQQRDRRARQEQAEEASPPRHRRGHHQVPQG